MLFNFQKQYYFHMNACLSSKSINCSMNNHFSSCVSYWSVENLLSASRSIEKSLVWHKSKPKVIGAHACFLWLYSSHVSFMHIHMWNIQDWPINPALWPVNQFRINWNLWKKVKWNRIQDLYILHNVYHIKICFTINNLLFI